MQPKFLSKVERTVDRFLRRLDHRLQNRQIYKIISLLAVFYFLYIQYKKAALLYRMRHTISIKQNAIDLLYKGAKYFNQAKVRKKLNDSLMPFQKKIEDQREKMGLTGLMPEDGLSPVEILKKFDIDPKACAYDFENAPAEDKQFVLGADEGFDSGAVYAVYPRELEELLGVISSKNLKSNLMHGKWIQLAALQSEIFKWMQTLLHGGGFGVITNGGSDSILHAMSAYVQAARKKGINEPEIVVPSTAHAAFEKAAGITGARLIVVPVDPKTGAVSARKMRKYISQNTAVIVGSAPSFMYGITDPIEDLGNLAQEKKVPFHVDACLTDKHFRKNESVVWDFRAPGVTSISTDTHKYGECPKGSSIVMFNELPEDLLSLIQDYFTTVFPALGWIGGLYTTDGHLGSKSGLNVAHIYATFAYFGLKHFQETAEKIVCLREKIQQDLNIELSNFSLTHYIQIFGDPKDTVLGFRSTSLDAHYIAAEMAKSGWELNYLQKPKGFHLCLTGVHTLVKDFAQKFVTDLVQSAIAVSGYPKDYQASGNIKVYGQLETMPTEVGELFCIGYSLANKGMWKWGKESVQESAQLPVNPATGLKSEVRSSL